MAKSDQVMNSAYEAAEARALDLLKKLVKDVADQGKRDRSWGLVGNLESLVANLQESHDVLAAKGEFKRG